MALSNTTLLRTFWHAVVPRSCLYRLVFLLLNVCVVFVRPMEVDFTVEVPAGSQQCYYQSINDAKHINMDIDYQVISGGDLDINFMIVNPNGVVLITEQRRQDAYHRINVADVKGDYQICLDNSFSYQARKLVFFEILLFDKDDRTDNLAFGTASDASHAEQQMIAERIGISIENFKNTAVRIKTNLNKAEHYQALLRAYEARDRAVMDANYDRVNLWSVVNGFVLIAVGFIQVYTIRSLFEENSKLRRILNRNK